MGNPLHRRSGRALSFFHHPKSVWAFVRANETNWQCVGNSCFARPRVLSAQKWAGAVCDEGKLVSGREIGVGEGKLVSVHFIAASRSGRPLGTAEWMEQIAQRLKIDLLPCPRGRPRKKQRTDTNYSPQETTN